MNKSGYAETLLAGHSGARFEIVHVASFCMFPKSLRPECLLYRGQFFEEVAATVPLEIRGVVCRIVLCVLCELPRLCAYSTLNICFAGVPMPSGNFTGTMCLGSDSKVSVRASIVLNSMVSYSQCSYSAIHLKMVWIMV